MSPRRVERSSYFRLEWCILLIDVSGTWHICSLMWQLMCLPQAAAVGTYCVMRVEHVSGKLVRNRVRIPAVVGSCVRETFACCKPCSYRISEEDVKTSVVIILEFFFFFCRGTYV